MNDDYLWDGSGEPHPEIQKLEKALSKYGHQGQAPEFPEMAVIRRPRLLRWGLGFRWTHALAAAAGLTLFIAALGILRWSQPANTSPGQGWDVERVTGTPQVESNATGKTGANSKLGVGQTLVTDSHSQANITVAEIGTVNVEPNSRLRLLDEGQGRHRLALDRGTIHAYIWAAPGLFTVDTPSAIAVDLGCRYTLQVDDSGAGLLRTSLGWVGFKLDHREAFIPAGAVCATRPKIGPGTPYFDDAPKSFCEALSRFDFSAGTAEERNAELDKILGASRQRDALTVWHLLARVDDSTRGRVYDRLATLVPPPSGVTREGILRLDQKMLDLWWNRLDLGDVSLWRTWERSWTPDKTIGM
jgi:FecR protein